MADPPLFVGAANCITPPLFTGVAVKLVGGLGADKTFNLLLNGASGAGVTVTQTNPTQANQGSMSIQCNPCGSYSYIRQ